MAEKATDMMKAAGMCPHGNFPSKCAQCAEGANKEQGASHKVEVYITEHLRKEVSPERKTELNKELASVMDFFDTAGIDTYIAGGTGIDLLDEEWNRDHQDLDVAIMGSNRQKFFDVATREGFLITDPDRRSLSPEEIVSPETHNAFLFRSNEQGFTQFEVIFLNETPTGDVALTKRAAALRTTYEQAPKVNVAGREIAIQPPDIILFHKLTDGRRKDFRDAKKVWDTLQDEQRERVVDYLEKAGVRFAIDGVEITDVPSLFLAAERKDAELHRDFFDKKVDGLEAELTHELMEKCEEVYAIRQGVAEQSAFFEELAAKYEGFMPERRVVLEAMAEYLYQTPPPAIDAFKLWAKQFVKSDDRVKQRALHEYVSEKLWEVKTEDAERMLFQERDPFEDFLEHIDQQGTRREPTVREREKMDKSLSSLGQLFEGTGIRWQLDGALNISLMRGEYIGIHKDIDVSIEADDMVLLEKKLAERGYGLFLSYPKNPDEPKGKKVMERVDAATFLAAAEKDHGRHPLIAAVDATGRVREKGDLNFIDTHVVRRSGESPIGWNGVHLPPEWYEPVRTPFQGTELSLSHPAKVAYFKLHGTRSYDRTDLKLLAESGKMTVADVEQVATVMSAEQEARLQRAASLFSGIFERIEPSMDKDQIKLIFAEDAVVGTRVKDFTTQLDELSGIIASSGRRTFDELRGEIIRIFQFDATIKKETEQLDELRSWVTSSTSKE